MATSPRIWASTSGASSYKQPSTNSTLDRLRGTETEYPGTVETDRFGELERDVGELMGVNLHRLLSRDRAAALPFAAAVVPPIVESYERMPGPYRC